MDSDIRICKTDWDSDQTRLRLIRQQVFVREQHVPEDVAFDAEDPGDTHFLAETADGKPVGAARLSPAGQISRLSVLEEHRSEGIGRQLLQAAIDEACAKGLREVFLHAQTHATSFYEAAGFSVDGGIFLEADIPHRLMVRILPAGGQ